MEFESASPNTEKKLTDSEALEAMKAESLGRIKHFYENEGLKRWFPEFFGTGKVINKELKEYLRKNGIGREYVSNPVLVERKEVEELLKTPEFNCDQDFMIEATRLDQANIMYTDRALFRDHDFLVRLLNEFGPKLLSIVYNLFESLKIDEEIVLECVKKDPHFITAVLDRVSSDTDFMIKTIDANPQVYKYLPSYCRSVRRLFLQALNNGYDDIYDNVPEVFRDDREVNLLFAKNALSTRPLSNFFDDPSFLAEVYTRENIMKHLEKDISAVLRLPLSVLEDAELVKEILSRFPDSLQYIKMLEEHHEKKFL